MSIEQQPNCLDRRKLRGAMVGHLGFEIEHEDGSGGDESNETRRRSS
jgi:hypothetical protein